MELAENQVRNVPHTLQKQRGSPTCPAPPCDFHCIHGRGPRAHCMPGSKVPPLHPRGHPGYPATSRHLGNLLRPFFQPASPGGFKLGAPFDLLKGMWESNWERAWRVQKEGGMVEGRGGCPKPECCYGDTREGCGLAFLPYMLEQQAPRRNSGWSPL